MYKQSIQRFEGVQSRAKLDPYCCVVARGMWACNVKQLSLASSLCQVRC